MPQHRSHLMQRSPLRTHAAGMRGFTLMELMIVVVIVGILAAIAYPNYQESVRKSRRSDAKTALSDLAARQEQYFNDNKTYTDNPTTLDAKFKGKTTTEQGFYNITIAAGGTGSLVSSYQITATAIGIQASDTKCATLTYASSGSKGSTPAGGSCW